MTSIISLVIFGLVVATASAGYPIGLGGTSYSVVTKHEVPHHSNHIVQGYEVIGKHYEHKEPEPKRYPKYSFDYGVKDTHTGDQKSQWEIRDGDRVKGGYTLKEADGTTRIVEYTADDHSGFNAIVKNVGHAYHPQSYNKVESYDHGADLYHVGGNHGSLGDYSVSAYDHGHGLASSYVNVKQHL